MAYRGGLGTKQYIGTYYFPPEPPRVDNVSTKRTGVGTPGALGRPKAAVIGTGRVEGIPVYGQTKVVTTTYRGERIGSEFELTYPEPTSVATIDVGYLLCRDYFGRGYDIIRIEANDEVVFDAENGAIPKIAFRFYNGLQTTVDPLVRTIVGANAGAHTGDVLLFLPDFPSLTAPTINVVISNAATDTGGTQEITWTGEEPVNLNNTQRSAYDPVDGLIYQVLTTAEIPSLTTCYLSVLDVDTETELYRVPLEDSSTYVNNAAFIIALRGSGHVVIRLSVPAETTSPSRVYNASTGRIVAEWREETDESIYWMMSQPFDENWLLLGADVDGSGGLGTLMAVIDIASGSFDVTRNDVALGSVYFSLGRHLAGSASFFVHSSSTCTEVTYGETWSTTSAYSSVGVVTGIHYDPLTEYLLVLEEFPSGTHNVQLVTPDTGAIADAFTVSSILFPLVDNLTCDRAFPKPGFALFRTSSSEELWAIDINAKTATLLDDVDAQTGEEARWGLYDQARLSYFMASGDTVWTKYTLPGTQPGEITLESHISDLLTGLGPYTIDQIEFSGFEDLSDWGDVIDKDGTNIRTILRSYQDPLGFVWTDIGSKIFFRKTPTDGSFTADVTVNDSDLVFKKGGSIGSNDRGDITRIAKVSLEYISRDDNYQSRTVTADTYGALYEVTRSTREAQYQTSLTLSDADGERLVNEILWNLQAKDRTHAFSAYGEFARMIPGDVISVASGDISYTVELTKVNIRENLVVDLEARDFQTSLSADVASVTNAGFSGISTVTPQSQYIHLDIPLLRYSDDAGGAWIVQYGVVASRGQPNWGGGSLYSGATAGDLSVEYDQAAHGGVIGICIDALGNPVDPFATTDDSTVTFRKISGDATLLVDKTEDEVLAGKNLAFVGFAGRWEGVGYKTVTDNGDGTYTLSGFTVRGYRGTEVFAPFHQAGDLFVMASAAWIEPVLHPAAGLNGTRFYKAVGFGQSPAAAIVGSHVLRGAAETPYAPVNLNAALGSPDGIDLSCDYRSRLASGLNPANFGETALAFEWDIMDGSTVVRTLESSAGAVHYDDADIITDFGTYPAAIAFRVYMVSAVVGRGYRAQASIALTYTLTADTTVIRADSTYFTADQE
ncbi:phage tail protein [Mesorhizobium sp. M0239]|uniref:phage tail protein n=1 Tax=Mesorhizobium sp. M0239 TaxID=2956924 RepID=UPI003337F938